jgi:hypothetical protein
MATAIERNGQSSEPATLHRVHHYVEQRIADTHKYGEDEERAIDDLKELFGDDWTVESEDEGRLTAEQADANADQEVAHHIIATLARVYPLAPDQRAALPVTE